MLKACLRFFSFFQIRYPFPFNQEKKVKAVDRFFSINRSRLQSNGSAF